MGPTKKAQMLVLQKHLVTLYRVSIFVTILLLMGHFVCLCTSLFSRQKPFIYVSSFCIPHRTTLLPPPNRLLPIMNGLPALPAVAIRDRATHYTATYLKRTKYYIAAYLLGWSALDTTHYLLGRAAAMWEQRWDDLGYEGCVWESVKDS